MNKPTTKIVAIVLIMTCCALSAMTFALSVKDDADTAIVTYTVAIDAGHGGIDGGVVASDGTKESDLNLAYAHQLKKLFELGGFNAEMTRNTSAGLYGLPTKGFKRRDMLARKKIVADCGANVCISVHMNKFADSTRSGCQVFFQKGDEEGEKLAVAIQQNLNAASGGNYSALCGDYFMCREIGCTAVIVEFGFLSNENECRLLCTDEYKEKLCNAVYCGLLQYLCR